MVKRRDLDFCYFSGTIFIKHIKTKCTVQQTKSLEHRIQRGQKYVLENSLSIITKSAPKMFSNAKIRYKLFNDCQRNVCTFAKKCWFTKKVRNWDIVFLKEPSEILVLSANFFLYFREKFRKNIIVFELTDKADATNWQFIVNNIYLIK